MNRKVSQTDAVSLPFRFATFTRHLPGFAQGMFVVVHEATVRLPAQLP